MNYLERQTGGGNGGDGAVLGFFSNVQLVLILRSICKKIDNLASRVRASDHIFYSLLVSALFNIKVVVALFNIKVVVEEEINFALSSFAVLLITASPQIYCPVCHHWIWSDTI